jgi:hypothetical protein
MRSFFQLIPGGPWPSGYELTSVTHVPVQV